MKMLKPCDVCGTAIGKYMCRNCKGNVCEADYDKEDGLCENCKFNVA